MKYPNVTLGRVEAVWNILGGEEGVDQLLRGERVVKTMELLHKVAEVAVNGAKRFVANNDHLFEANVVWTNDNFKRLFLNKVEEDVNGVTIIVHRLERASPDASILVELGNRTQISLVHFFELLKKQSKGEFGPLLSNGYANIAYVTGSDGNLWAVNAYWSGVGWQMSAYSVEYPEGWNDGYQILSR